MEQRWQHFEFICQKQASRTDGTTARTGCQHTCRGLAMQQLCEEAVAAADGSSKRQRLGPLQEPATFERIVERAGIRGLSHAAVAGQQPPQPPEVDDPRAAKRQLAADLGTAAARAAFVGSLGDVLATEELLHACLLPISVTVQVSHANGDSFMRLLLNMLPLQQQVATLLLHKLPEFSSAECDDDSGTAGGGASSSSLPNLILGQLRWLEVVADAEALMATVLQVLPVCSAPIQQQLLGFLPEVAQPHEHGLVLEQLTTLLEQDLRFMAAVLDCIANLQLEPHLQVQTAELLLAQLPAVEVEDLPGLVSHLLGAAGKASAERVMAVLRGCLHFVAACDPRLAVPDTKQKRPARPAARSPEVLLVKEAVTALQANEAAGMAAMQLIGGLQEPSAHNVFDLLVLLALHAKGGAVRRTVEALLRKKLTEGGLSPAWLSRALQGRQAVFREVWPSLLVLAEGWSRAREPPLAAAAWQLYCDLFVVFESNLERQQVLQALHGHLGSGVVCEQDAALQALSVLASSQRPLLVQYSSYLANVLDHLERFSDGQLHTLFGAFAALTALQPAAGGTDAAAAGGGSTPAAAAAAPPAPCGSRLEDELAITLNKALGHASAGYKRIGVIGTLALLRQAAADQQLLSDADGARERECSDAWVSRAEALFSACVGSPGVLAFLMEQWSQQLEAAPAPGQAAASHMPRPLLDWLSEKVQDLMNAAFITDYCPPAPSQLAEGQPLAPPQPTIALDDPNLQAALWLNLDGCFSPVYLQVLPLLAARDPARRQLLLWMPAGLRLLAAVSRRASSGTLLGIDALLGCPLALPDLALFTDSRWDGLPVPSKATVLASLLHAISWLREVVAVFAPSLGPDALLAAGSDSTQAADAMADTQNKLLMRLSQLRALEALYRGLATGCPAAALLLPDVSSPLLCASLPGGLAAAPAAALRRAATAGAGGAGSSKAEPLAVTQADVEGRLRCLRLPAMAALNTCQPPHMLLTSLLPATHLAADLHAKLKLLIGRARRPAGLMAPPATQAAIAPGGLLCGPAQPPAGAGGPPCLQGVGLAQLVQQLVPLLPPLQQHMMTALSVLRQPPAGGWEALQEGLPGTGDACEAPLYSLPLVEPQMDAVAAARSLAISGMQVFASLLGCSRELPASVMQQVLRALAGQNAPAAAAAGAAAADEQAAMHQLLLAAFRASRKLSCHAKDGGPSCSSLPLELGVVSLLQAITALSAAQQLPQHAKMGAIVSSKAAALLQDSWAPLDEAQGAAEGAASFSWKGQSGAISQLLALLISHAPDPSAQLLSMATEVLPQVPDKVPAKQQMDAVAGYASLCSATFLTWYKVVFEQLLVQADKLVREGLVQLAAAGGGASQQGGGRRKQAAQLNSQGLPGWDDAKISELLGAVQRCGVAFQELVSLSKVHQSRSGLLAAAVKQGGGFVDVLLRGLPLWRAVSCSGFHEQFVRLVKDVQKGTRVMQILCNEGKARSAAPLLSRAPAARRSLERFVFEMKALFRQAGAEQFMVAPLKHKDLNGQTVGSQMYPGAEEEDEEDDDADERYAGDD